MTDETFTRTSPPLNRFTVKLGYTGPAPWEVLTAKEAREIADAIQRSGRVVYGPHWEVVLRDYADAWDAMTQQPALDLSVEALAG